MWRAMHPDGDHWVDGFGSEKISRTVYRNSRNVEDRLVAEGFNGDGYVKIFFIVLSVNTVKTIHL